MAVESAVKISLPGLFHGSFSSIGHQKRDGQALNDDALDKQLGFYFYEKKGAFLVGLEPALGRKQGLGKGFWFWISHPGMSSLFCLGGIEV